jgi:hypothetical protein
MSVRVKFELLIPGFESVKDIQEYVSAQDALDCDDLSSDDPSDAIAPQHVKGSDVLTYYFLGRMPNTFLDEGRIPTYYPEEVIEVDVLEEA